MGTVALESGGVIETEPYRTVPVTRPQERRHQAPGVDRNRAAWVLRPGFTTQDGRNDSTTGLAGD